MKLLALIESLDHVCYRYRIEAFAWALAEQGWLLEPAPLRRPTRRRIGQLASARHADAVILQRKLLPVWQLAILRRAARCLVYDVDDAVFHRDSYHHKPPESWQRTARFWATVYAADATIVGNDYLYGRAAGYVEADRVEIIPTCVEPRFYPLARHDRSGPNVRLVWIGQQATLPSLHRARAHLAAASQRVAGLELRMICDSFPHLAGVRVEPRPWSAATEAVELSQCDIGVSWLPDDPWSRGKCGLKVLQYMAAGLPVVANPVGMNREMVLDGRTGLLAESPEQWAAAIRKLAADPPLRRKMGAAGRRLVERHYSVGEWGPELARAIAGAAARARAVSPAPGHDAHVGLPGRTSRDRRLEAGPRSLPCRTPRQPALERQP
jgi:hypothetical protein